MTDVEQAPRADVEPVAQRIAKPSSALRQLLRSWSFRTGVGIVVFFLALAAFAPWISPYPPLSLHPPLTPWFTSGYILGTDPLGRDVLSMTIYGARVSLLFAFGGAGLSLIVGVLMGAIPAFYGGWLDETASRFYEVVLMLPQLFLIITIVVFTGGNTLLVVLIVGLTIWPTNARIMRAQVLSVKRRLYVDAARTSGRSRLYTLFHHVIPNSIGPVIANSTLQMAYAVLTEAGLSFLGLTNANVPSWGVLLNEAQQNIIAASWLVVVPGVALVVLLIGLHTVGDAVAAALDPRSSRKD